jgi:hypothetical protein
VILTYTRHQVSSWSGSRTDTPKIGITRDTIKWLQQNGYPDLTEGEIEEEYSPAIYTSDGTNRRNVLVEIDRIDWIL